MLSKIIKERIEQRFGKSIRYSKDCEALSASIAKHCKANISPSTLKRLFGFNQGKQMTRPRLYTLDVLGSYLGYTTWNELMQSLDTNAEPEQGVIENVVASELNVGDSLSLTFNPNVELQLWYAGKNMFEVTKSNSHELTDGDNVELREIILHYPLFIAKLIRDGHDLGRVMLGDISGITSIKKDRLAEKH